MSCWASVSYSTLSTRSFTTSASVMSPWFDSQVTPMLHPCTSSLSPLRPPPTHTHYSYTSKRVNHARTHRLGFVNSCMNIFFVHPFFGLFFSRQHNSEIIFSVGKKGNFSSNCKLNTELVFHVTLPPSLFLTSFPPSLPLSPSFLPPSQNMSHHLVFCYVAGK